MSFFPVRHGEVPGVVPVKALALRPKLSAALDLTELLPMEKHPFDRSASSREAEQRSREPHAIVDNLSWGIASARQWNRKLALKVVHNVTAACV